jgi:hypothetical protein
LKDVTVEWATPLLLEDSELYFYDIDDSAILHVPVGTKALYEVANVWKDFGTIREDAGTSVLPATPEAYVSYSQGLLTVSTPVAEQVAVYSTTGALLYQAQKGIGKAVYHLEHLPSGVLIATGASGWVKKIVR